MWRENNRSDAHLLCHSKSPCHVLVANESSDPIPLLSCSCLLSSPPSNRHDTWGALSKLPQMVMAFSRFQPIWDHAEANVAHVVTLLGRHSNYSAVVELCIEEWDLEPAISKAVRQLHEWKRMALSRVWGESIYARSLLSTAHCPLIYWLHL